MPLLLLFHVTIAFPLVAESRTSANYLISADIVDAGGLAASSANYSSIASLGGIVGTSTAVPAETVRHGYIGQLSEVTGVSVSSTSLTLDEGSTRQLSATAVLDDATVVMLTGSQVAWSILSGPIVSVTPGGLAMAGNVYQDSAAIVRASYQQKNATLSLNILDVFLDNFGSYAGDGLADEWQIHYFGQNNPDAAPGADPDGDRQNNLFEYLAGTVPTNAASHFSLSIANVGPVRRMLTFGPRMTNRNYTVQFTTNLVSGVFSTLTNAPVSDVGVTRMVTDTNAISSLKFYRVGITLP